MFSTAFTPLDRDGCTAEKIGTGKEKFFICDSSDAGQTRQTDSHFHTSGESHPNEALSIPICLFALPVLCASRYT